MSSVSGICEFSLCNSFIFCFAAIDLWQFCLFWQDTDETIRVVAMDKDFHVDCYHCEVSMP